VQPQQYVSLHEAAEVEIRVSNITRYAADPAARQRRLQAAPPKWQ
jgi:hypothetical protein